MKYKSNQIHIIITNNMQFSIYLSLVDISTPPAPLSRSLHFHARSAITLALLAPLSRRSLRSKWSRSRLPHALDWMNRYCHSISHLKYLYWFINLYVNLLFDVYLYLYLYFIHLLKLITFLNWALGLYSGFDDGLQSSPNNMNAGFDKLKIIKNLVVGFKDYEI